MSDHRPGSSPDGQSPPADGPSGANGHGHGPRELDRLPPPAFPPGARTLGHRVRRSAEIRGLQPEPQPESGEGVPDDAFISPDDPIVRSGSRIAPGAFISPDEPLPSRDQLDPDEVVVTGIGDDPHLSPADLAVARYTDPHVADLVQRVGQLADALREKGEAGLRTTPEMSRFEATLRAYCVGYLAAQREPRSE
jgi:hypothetical protein